MLLYNVAGYVCFQFPIFPFSEFKVTRYIYGFISEYHPVFISLCDFDLKHRFFKTGLCHLSVTQPFFFPVVFGPKNVVLILPPEDGFSKTSNAVFCVDSLDLLSIFLWFVIVSKVLLIPSFVNL